MLSAADAGICSADYRFIESPLTAMTDALPAAVDDGC